MKSGTNDLRHAEAAGAFYEQRYQTDYMKEWPVEKRERVARLIQGLNLPATGSFLDFGCGTGVFTECLSQALPQWRAHGVDIVNAALQQATARCPSAAFCCLDALGDAAFDLVFSHHVIEHVQDLDDTLALLARVTRPGGTMVAILPCGNQGSLEHRLCTARRDGIESEMGDRFFFEDEGHLRRLTSAGFAASAASHGFALRKQFFANHYYGALKWLTDQSPTWLKEIIDPARAVDEESRVWLQSLRRRVLGLRFLKRPPSLLVPGMEWRLQKPRRSLIETVALCVSNPMTMFSGSVERWIQRADEREWSDRATDQAGSEMYLVFAKGDSEMAS